MRDQTAGIALETLATAAPSPWQRAGAALFAAASLAASWALAPIASSAIPPMPGFVPVYQSVLIVVYALTTYLFFAQYRHARSVPLLVLGAGGLYTTLIVAAQLLSFPGVLAPKPLLGAGSQTTTWLWTLWHLGPPVVATGYALLEPGAARRKAMAGPSSGAAWIAGGLAVLAAAAGILAVTRFIEFLPRTVEGDDYSLLTRTGIGPGIIALTMLALVLLCWRTRLRTVLQLWLAVSLLLLVADNVVTLVGAARGTVGWFAGRLEALTAGVVVLVVYLREVDLLYRRAEMTALERERARAAIERARDSLAVAVDAAGMGDWDLDLRTGLWRRTLRHDQIFGYRENAPAWSLAALADHVVPEDRDAVTAAFERARAEGRLDLECRIRRVSDGAVRWITMRGHTRHDPAGRGVGMAGIVMDVTERHAVEDRAKQAERMEVVGQLTGGVAHDFNNLLTVIVGNLDLMLRRAADPAEVQRLVTNAMVAARRGCEVTDKLLSFSRRQLVRAETVNVNRLLTEMKPRLEREAGGRVQVMLDLDPTLDPATLDPAQFEAAILNLVLNARDALPRGGAVRIASGALALAAADADEALGAGAIGQVQPGAYVRVAVTDKGMGMEKLIADKAFEPFFTTKDISTGAGLGLSQVYGFAKQAHGHVRLDTAPGRGTTVEILLPQTRQPLQHAARQAGAEMAPQRAGGELVPLRRASGGEVVLVVEDDAIVRDMAVESLRDLGYQALAAANAADALECLATDERIDVLFSDVVMPGGMNGVQLAVEARRARPSLKVLLTSGYTALTDDRTVPSDVLLLPKPYRRAQLATQLRVVMAG